LLPMPAVYNRYGLIVNILAKLGPIFRFGE
jgi:hypothetical protein